MTSNVRALLVAARETISDPTRWCQGESARDAKGRPCEPDDEAAVQWCAVGAVVRAARACESLLSANRAVAVLDRTVGGSDFFLNAGSGQAMAGYQDKASHVETLAALDRAIASIPKEAP